MKSAPRAEAPVNVPQTAKPARPFARVCIQAENPESATTATLAISAFLQAGLWSAFESAATFHTPVTTSTAKAVHAAWLNRRATEAGASGPRALKAGRIHARVTWPPTHTVAART